MEEIRAGIWHWRARHPEWEEGQWWGPEVSCYAADDGDRLVVFDPVAAPPELARLAAERATTIVLTCPWHRREAEALSETLAAPVFVPPPDDWDPSPVAGTVFRDGDVLPNGVEARTGIEANDLVLWLPGHRAIVAGDTLQDRGDGLRFLGDLANNVPAGTPTAAAIIEPLLALPVETVLLTHGGPADRSDLEAALGRSQGPGPGRRPA